MAIVYSTEIEVTNLMQFAYDNYVDYLSRKEQLETEGRYDKVKANRLYLEFCNICERENRIPSKVADVIRKSKNS